jgi:branched-subunit amino acid aminotransferase/4-amino-4-deoxychorismate lyase
MGEPFSGVVIPHLVRAVGINGTGCLKLGVNYLMSVKAVEEAKTIWPTAASALFLDDNPTADLYSRKITEWDSSCCLIGLRDGTTIKIPESSLILPSVTIQGMVAILKHLNQPVVERDITYGEFVEKSRKNEIIAVCSIGTAGILNRCERIALIDEHKHIIGEQVADPTHPLYQKYGEAKKILWDIYKGEFPAITGMQRDVYPIR